MAEKLTPAEIYTRLSKRDTAIELHRAALSAGMPLSRYLEVLDPSPENSRIDAFGRQLREAGIITRSDPQAGYWASEGKVFFDTDAGRALFPEFFRRQWNSITYAPPKERAILLSSDSVLGSFEKPYVEAGPFWNSQFEPAIPLSELVATTTPISGEDYRSLYMTYDAEKLRMFRVGESAEIPLSDLSTAERSIRLRKYGRGLRTSYEQLRRVRVDKIAWWIRWQSLQSEVDKVTAALDVLISGDGNNGTAATEYNMLTLDPDATANELSYKAWLAFRMKWESPYQMTTALMQVDEALQLILLNSGSANIPLAGLNVAGIGNSLTPINTTADGIRYGWTSEAPNNKIVGFDKRFALELITEIGSEISETERFITNQTQVMTMTENSAFAILDPAATKLLDISE